jgi:hypothetical protein
VSLNLIFVGFMVEFQILINGRPHLTGDWESIQEECERLMNEILNDHINDQYYAGLCDAEGLWWCDSLGSWLPNSPGSYIPGTRYGIRGDVFIIRRLEA